MVWALSVKIVRFVRWPFLSRVRAKGYDRQADRRACARRRLAWGDAHGQELFVVAGAFAYPAGCRDPGLYRRQTKALVLTYVLISFVRPTRWWPWLQVAACVAVLYGVITYLAAPAILLLEGLPWEAVQYSF